MWVLGTKLRSSEEQWYSWLLNHLSSLHCLKKNICIYSLTISYTCIMIICTPSSPSCPPQVHTQHVFLLLHALCFAFLTQWVRLVLRVGCWLVLAWSCAVTTAAVSSHMQWPYHVQRTGFCISRPHSWLLQPCRPLFWVTLWALGVGFT